MNKIAKRFLDNASGAAMIFLLAVLTFYDSMRKGMSGYDHPTVRQLPLWFFLGFVDNFFYLLRIDGYSPAMNSFLFVGFFLGVVSAMHGERLAVGARPLC